MTAAGPALVTVTEVTNPPAQASVLVVHLSPAGAGVDWVGVGVGWVAVGVGWVGVGVGWVGVGDGLCTEQLPVETFRPVLAPAVPLTTCGTQLAASSGKEYGMLTDVFDCGLGPAGL